MNSANPINSSDQFPSEERNLLSLFSRKKDLILTLVNRRLSDDDNIRKSISKPDLQNLVEELLTKGTLQSSDIAAIVTELQGWGRQQIYLYRVTTDESEVRNWLDLEWVKARFEQKGLKDIFNCARPIDSFEDLTLFETDYSQHNGRIRFKWAEEIGTLERRPEDDIKKPFALSDDGTSYERMVYHAYLESYATDISTFEWDICNKDAMFMIRKQSNRSYKDVRDGMIADLANVVPIKHRFEQVELRKLLRNLDGIEEVNKRRLRYKSTHSGATITVSSGNQQDVFDDAVIQQAHRNFVSDTDRLGGTVGWPVNGRKDIGVYIYAREKHDQRIGIGAQELEDDIRTVLRDIKRYST